MDLSYTFLGSIQGGLINQTPTKDESSPYIERFIICRCLIYQTHICFYTIKKVGLMNQALTGLIIF